MLTTNHVAVFYLKVRASIVGGAPNHPKSAKRPSWSFCLGFRKGVRFKKSTFGVKMLTFWGPTPPPPHRFWLQAWSQLLILDYSSQNQRTWWKIRPNT